MGAKASPGRGQLEQTRVQKVKHWWWFILVGLGLAACQSVNPSAAVVERTVPVTRETEVEVTREVVATVQVAVEVTREVFIPLEATVAPLGTAERPIRLVLAPMTSPEAVTARGEALAAALAEGTGLHYQLVTPATQAEAIAAACEAPAETVAFLPAISFVVAHEQCDLQAGQAGVRFGIPWSASMAVVRGGRSLRTLNDLAGQTWGVASERDVASALFFQAQFKALGIEPGPITTFDTDAAAMIALYDDQVQFATADFKPPILPFNERLWVYGEDDPEIWRRVAAAPFRSGVGFIVVQDYPERGGYHIRDARAAVFDARPLIFAATVILALSDPLPNDAIAYGTAFPLGLARSLGAFLETYATSPECAQSLCSADYFHWEGVAPMEDAAYDPLRFVQQQLELTDEAFLTYLEP